MTTGYILLDSPNRAQPQGTYPRRGGHKPSGTVIVHTSEGNWRSGVDGLTRLVQTRADWGCYHRACDWQDIALYYPWEWECWQDTETNNWAVGIAAACRAADWPALPDDIREGYYRNLGVMAADFVKYMRDQYGVIVPLRRLTGAEARARVPGFCAHGDSGLHRSDPGPAFDWAKFFACTAQALTGTLAYASAESITPLTPIQEDDVALTKKQEEALDMIPMIREMINNVASGVNEVPGKTLAKEVPVANAGGVTSLQTFLSYAPADREATVSRIRDAIANTPAAELAVQIDAAGLAAAVRDELVELLKGK